jgi:hypothetical protein
MKEKRKPFLFVILGIAIFAFMFPANQYSFSRLVFVFFLSAILYKLGEYVRDKVVRK